MKRYKTILAFSLVELSVVLIIISLTLAAGLSLATKKTESTKITVTEERLATIEKALARFLSENYRLPCPADATIAINSANFGIEAKSGVNPINCNSNSNSGSVVWAGAIPTKTLELQDEYMFDGYDRRFTYIIDRNFANSFDDAPSTTNNLCDNGSGASGKICFQYKDNGSITVKAGVASGNTRTTQAVYVILSHGKNGHGAYIRQGSSTRLNTGSTHPDEIENAESGVAFDSIFVQAEKSDDYLGVATADFDDIVRYKLKWQIINEASGITDSSLCSLAKNVFDNPSPATNLTCTGATSTTICESFAKNVYFKCFDQ